MAKLMDIFNRIAYKGNVNVSNMDTASQKAFQAHATKMANDFKAIEEAEKQIAETNDKIIRLKQKGVKNFTDADKEIMQQYQDLLADASKKWSKSAKKLDHMEQLLENRYHLSDDQIAKLNDMVSKNASAILEGNKKYSTSIYGLNNAIKGGTGGMVEIAKDFFAEFGFMGQTIGLAIEQMEELNKKLIEFNRSMSLGFSNNLLGMDLYGNSMVGSLATVSGSNNLSEDEFLNAFRGLNKGNALNRENVGSQQEIREFGVNAGQLSKFYGVEMNSLNSISSNLIYTYGMKIKDVSKIFDDGKKSAIAAGVSVRQYFENLKEATELVGQQYIAGGIKGLQDLALYAAKTDQSISSIMKTSERFKSYTDQFAKQNTAAALAMQNTAKETSKIWSLEFLGRKQEADQLFKGSLVKDVIQNGMIDKDNNINGRGLATLQGMDLDQEQIKSIQKLIKLQQDYGISIDQLNNKEKQSLDVQAKIQDYEYKNLTIAEKFQSMWAKIKGAVIDPITSILSPMFDMAINLIGTTVDILTPILKVFGYPLQALGKALTVVSELFSKGLSYVSGFFNKLTGALDGSVDKLGMFSKILLATIGSLLSLRILSGSQGIAKGVGSVLSMVPGKFGKIGRIGKVMAAGRGSLIGMGSVNPAGAGVASKAGGMLSKIGGLGGGKLLKGFGIGAVASIGGEMLGDAVGGKGGSAISNIASAAGTGAMIGSIIPVVGTAVGAIVGGVAGLVYSSKDKIAKVWADDSKGWVAKIWGTYTSLFETIGEAMKGIWEWGKSLFSDDDKEKFTANQAAQQAMNPYAAMKALDDVKRVVDYRESKAENSFAKEQEREKAMQKVFAPTITIKQSFDGTIKTRVQGK